VNPLYPIRLPFAKTKMSGSVILKQVEVAVSEFDSPMSKYVRSRMERINGRVQVTLDLGFDTEFNVSGRPELILEVSFMLSEQMVMSRPVLRETVLDALNILQDKVHKVSPDHA
jgi:hypothetical protein